MIRKLCRLAMRQAENWLPDRQALCIRYWRELGRRPRLDPPTRFTEHILRLMGDKPDEIRRFVANKITLRDYVAAKIGPGHTPEIYRRYASAGDIVLADLPQKFVLKANHGSGFNRIVLDKATVDEAELRVEAASWLATDFYEITREYIYRGYPREVFAEELLEADGKICVDYKVFCFHGRPRMIEVVIDRDPDSPSLHSESFYDEAWNALDLSLGHPGAEPMPRPDNLPELMAVAAELSADFDFMRVDLYLCGKRIYVGELTSFTHAGRMIFEPDWRDEWLGQFFERSSEG